MAKAEPVPQTARRRQLLRGLRRLRVAAGLSCAQAGRLIDKSESAMYRLEDGQVARIRPVDVRLLCEGYGADTETVQRFVDLAADGKPLRGWWDQFGGPPAAWFATYLELEAEASDLSMWHPTLVPGLLQTRAYAREAMAVMSGASAAGEPEETERRVQIRMTRQEILDREDAPRLWVVLHETVLRQRIGGPAVMRDQLRHLAASNDRGNVTVQVLPYSAGTHAALFGGPVVLLGFPDPADPGVVYLENHTGALYLEESAEITRYIDIFNHLRASALSVADSRSLISAVVKEID